MIVKAYVVLRAGHTGDAALTKALQDHVKTKSRPTNIRARSNMSRACRAPRPASCNASSCARSRRTAQQARVLKGRDASVESPIRKFPAAAGATPCCSPTGWPQPKGYANGIKARGDMVIIGGMVGWDEQGKFPKGFVAQTRQALARTSRRCWPRAAPSPNISCG